MLKRFTGFDLFENIPKKPLLSKFFICRGFSNTVKKKEVAGAGYIRHAGDVGTPEVLDCPVSRMEQIQSPARTVMVPIVRNPGQ